MNGFCVRGSRPWMAMRNRLPHPAMARSGHAGASAVMIAWMISCEQWLVHSVTGAPSFAHTTVPGFAITSTGRNAPSFFGVCGSIRYASATTTAERMFGYDELTKPTTCSCESDRSMIRSLPRLVTVARTWMSV